MFGKWLEKASSSLGQKPIVVSWSPTGPGHSKNGIGRDTVKLIVSEYLTLRVFSPIIELESIRIDFIVSNTGNKALGLGAQGVGVMLISTQGKKLALTSAALIKDRHYSESEVRLQDLLVDFGESLKVTAVFEGATPSLRVDLVIQANRILAAPLLFMIPFEADEIISL